MASPNRNQPARELFSAACSLPEAQWDAFLADQCDDPDLRDEVLDLLRRDQRGTPALEQRALDTEQRAALAPMLSTPETIAEYTVVRLIGRGSMGSVYEAIQQGTGSRVAVKVLRTGIPSEALLHRFRREAELLARLEHPCIARIHESSHARIGPGEHPFIAMELVDGQPLDSWWREHGPDDRQRVDLLARISEGVEHAHSRGVLHRDLKPSNVLVDVHGRPRIIDFGVARTVSTDPQSWSLRTATGQMIGTLQYMSPEQVLGGETEIDARADVYALGVIGYELLSGRPPYDVESGPLSTVMERIRNEDPPLLGTLRAELRGDIETIIARALEKNPGDRYPTAKALVADLRASLDSLPITARRPSGFDQLRKFGERNPRIVRVAALFVGVLVLGLGGSIWGWSSARDQEQAVTRLLHEQIELTKEAESARREALSTIRESDIVLDFYDDLLTELSDPARGSYVRLQDVLEPAVASIGEWFAKTPRLEARMRLIVGTAFLKLSEYESALEQFNMAIAMTEDERDWTRVHARAHRAQVWRLTGRVADAIAELRDVRALYTPEDGEIYAQLTDALLRALDKNGDVGGAASVLDEVFAPGVELDVELTTLEDLQVERATLRSRRGEYAEAEAELREIVNARRRRLGPNHPRTLQASDHLADALMKQRKFAEAHDVLRQITAVMTERSGPEDPETLRFRELIVINGVDAEWYSKVVFEALELAEIYGRLYGPEHPKTAQITISMGISAAMAGHPEGEAFLFEAIDLARAVFGMDDDHLVRPFTIAARLYLGRGELKSGVELLREALRVALLSPNRSIPIEALLALRLALSLNQLERSAEAEEVARAALADATPALGESHSSSLGLLCILADALRRQERWEESLEVYERYARANPERSHSAWLEVDEQMPEVRAAIALSKGE